MKREYLQSTGARLAEAALAVSPGALFYRLSVGARQLGYSSTTVDTLADTIRVVDVLVIDVPALGRLHRTEGRSVATLDRALHLRGVTAELDGTDGQFVLSATVSADTVLHLTITAGGDSQTSTVPLSRPLVLPSLLPLRLAFGGELRLGRDVTARLLDPFTLSERDVAARVTAESTLVVADSADYDSTTMAWVPVRYDTMRAFRLDAPGTEGGGGGAQSTWIDAQGRVVRATAPLGFSMERTAFELAYENFRRRDTLRLLRSTAAPPPGEVIATTAIAAGLRPGPTPPERMRVRLGGAFDALDLSGGRQRLAGDTLIVERERGAHLVSHYRLPAARPSLQEFLLPEPLIESGDLRIQAQARLIAGNDRNPARVAARLAHWTATEIADGVAAAPSAVQVLGRRRGDCNEHTVLFIALARALGLPTRPVAGLLYLRGRFYYHAWAEVYLDDWVAVDPTFDQFPADAAHLRFVVGGLARQLELVKLLGSLTLEVS
ncbi:MAG: transglutaminase-like domain-containing protein [Gemmatimonadales bacterium]